MRYPILLICLFIFTACGSLPPLPPSTGEATSGPALAATVNGEPILLEEFHRQTAVLQSTLTTAESAAILQGLIDRQIMQQQARQLGVSLTAEEVAAQVAEARNSPGFGAWLAQNGLTEAQFTADLETQLLAQKLFERITAEVTPQQEMVRLHYIRVADQAQAEAVIERLKRGENFIEAGQSVAGSHSDYVDWFAPQAGLLPEAVETAAFKLQPGEIPPSITTPDGVYLIKLEGRVAIRPLSGAAWQALKQQIFLNWLQSQRSAARIETFTSQP